MAFMDRSLQGVAACWIWRRLGIFIDTEAEEFLVTSSSSRTVEVCCGFNSVQCVASRGKKHSQCL